MSLRQDFGANLRRLCQRDGLSIAGVCRGTGINRQQFNRYLAGTSLPNQSNIDKLCAYFKVPEAEIFRKPTSPLNTEPISLDPAPWSNDLRMVLKRIYSERAASIEPGIYSAYFAYPSDPSTILRAIVIVRRDGHLTSFRRLTGFAERCGSYWSHYTGDHRGIILERRHWLYFVALNRVATQEPTLLALRWVPNVDPVLSGHAMVMSPDGPTFTAVVLHLPRKRLSLRAAIRLSHAYSINDPSLDATALDVLDQQCRALTAMVSPLDLSVTPRPGHQLQVQW